MSNIKLHISVTVVILDNDEKNILLLKRAKNDRWLGKWECVGGKIEVGESPVNTAKREVF